MYVCVLEGWGHGHQIVFTERCVKYAISTVRRVSSSHAVDK